MKKLPLILGILLGYVSSNVYAITDDEIRQQMIEQSISSYSGNCPCPYNYASNGSRCGKRSAYSKPGGYAPLCFPTDISDKAVKEYRKSRGL